MTEPPDRAVLLLQKVGELLLDPALSFSSLKSSWIANHPPMPPIGSRMASSWPHSKRGS